MSGLNESNCQNCFESFNDSNRKPIILDCTKKCSTICSKCYVSYQKHPACSPMCPICQGLFTTGRLVSTIPINQHLLAKALKEANKITIVIKFQSKSYMVEDMTKFDTLMKLFKKIKKLTNVKFEDQNIIFSGESFIDKDPQTTLDELGVNSDSAMTLAKYTKGGVYYESLENHLNYILF